MNKIIIIVALTTKCFEPQVGFIIIVIITIIISIWGSIMKKW